LLALSSGLFWCAQPRRVAYTDLCCASHAPELVGPVNLTADDCIPTPTTLVAGRATPRIPQSRTAARAPRSRSPKWQQAAVHRFLSRGRALSELAWIQRDRNPFCAFKIDNTSRRQCQQHRHPRSARKPSRVRTFIIVFLCLRDLRMDLDACHGLNDAGCEQNRALEVARMRSPVPAASGSALLEFAAACQWPRAPVFTRSRRRWNVT
jgi:hypothetical protein